MCNYLLQLPIISNICLTIVWLPITLLQHSIACLSLLLYQTKLIFVLGINCYCTVASCNMTYISQYDIYFPRFSYFAVIFYKLQGVRNSENICHMALGNVWWLVLINWKWFIYIYDLLIMIYKLIENRNLSLFFCFPLLSHIYHIQYGQYCSLFVYFTVTSLA